jgi:hypothetical protein
VDVDGRKELGETALDGRPSQLMFLPDGRLAVLLRDKAKVAVLEPGDHPEQLDARCTVDTATEPVGLALTPDDGTLLVSSAWGRTLGAYDARSLAKSFQVALPREPRAVVVSDDGKYAFVSHAIGARATRVKLADKTVTDVPLLEHDEPMLQHERKIRLALKSMGKHGKNTKILDDQLKELAARTPRARASPSQRRRSRAAASSRRRSSSIRAIRASARPVTATTTTSPRRATSRSSTPRAASRCRRRSSGRTTTSAGAGSTHATRRSPSASCRVRPPSIRRRSRSSSRASGSTR